MALVGEAGRGGGTAGGGRERVGRRSSAQVSPSRARTRRTARVRARAVSRGPSVALCTREPFGHDNDNGDDNRAAVRTVEAEAPGLAGPAVHGPRPHGRDRGCGRMAA
ncbi:MAG TPA: hypothetical protein VE546_03145 [Streptomyces sp.]|uniref:hypothetical protein n=1 Tax=Streptomyces sp. TaxID=1931 RepID=UPI002D5886F4|nr:hypothetical protein [Streptomyces sp.]HZG02571.1 hypothetical protein [Streptomyces sp.]